RMKMLALDVTSAIREVLILVDLSMIRTCRDDLSPARRMGYNCGGLKMATKWLLIAPVAGALGIGAGIGFDQLLSAAAPGDAKQDVKPAVTLPITRVVLFNSGVGYFSRSGEVADDARVDLTFP